MMTELQEKIARLPAWAREHIKRLEIQPEYLASECAASRQKIANLEDKVRRLTEQIEAMSEMFRYAAIGGSSVAEKIVSILEGYEIFPPR